MGRTVGYSTAALPLGLGGREKLDGGTIDRQMFRSSSYILVGVTVLDYTGGGSKPERCNEAMPV
jgi:hypothetical protein